MNTWQICEKECFEYINKKFKCKNFNFTMEGGSDSSKSDILVIRNGIAIFYIETKMKKAQCGQFVVFPNEKERFFTYSKGNKYPENLQSSLIIEKMSKDFDRYKIPSIKGIKINIDDSFLYDWIYHFYKKNKNVRYFIIEKSVGANNLSDENFIIFPVEHFYKYFDIEAFYRKKKSGSSNPTLNDFDDIKQAISAEGFTINKIFQKDKYTYAELDAKKMIYKLTGETNKYQLKPDGNIFKVTKLSKTSNPNVIFEISLKKNQDERDLENFKREFQL